jgi:Kef-type K+ transport system membrane component KefB
MVPMLLFRFAFTWKETFAAGSLLSARLSLIIAASLIALEQEIITPAVNSAIILVAIITVTLSPIVFSKLMPNGKSEEE